MNSVIGIDPGNHSGVVVLSVGPSPKLLRWEKLNINGKKSPTPTRLVQSILDEEDSLVVSAAIEDQYLAKSVKSMKVLTRTSGRWMEAFLSVGIPISWVTPSTWQSAVFGRSAKTRDQYKLASVHLAKSETGIDLPVDVADAYCIGRYHAIQLHRASKCTPR